MTQNASSRRRPTKVERIENLLTQAGEILGSGRALGEGFRTKLLRAHQDLEDGIYNGALVEEERKLLTERVWRALTSPPNFVGNKPVAPKAGPNAAQEGSRIQWPEELATPEEVWQAWKHLFDKDRTRAVGKGFEMAKFAGLPMLTAMTLAYLPVHAVRVAAHWRYGQVGQFFER